jgi:hypothetical protein
MWFWCPELVVGSACDSRMMGTCQVTDDADIPPRLVEDQGRLEPDIPASGRAGQRGNDGPGVVPAGQT